MKKLKKLKVGDIVMGIDKRPREVLDIIKSRREKTYRVYFSNGHGHVDCTGDHLWPVNIRGQIDLLTTKYIMNLIKYGETKVYVGNNTNVEILKVKKNLFASLVSCIVVHPFEEKNKYTDKTFLIMTSNGSVVPTSNCQMRIGCGRLGSMASMMLFGSTVGTTINGSVPGSGLVSANGEASGIQYYFTEIDFIQDFYKKAGFDEKGRRKISTDQQGTSSQKEEDKTERMSDEELENIFSFNRDIETLEFGGVSTTIDKTEKQKFD